MPSIEFKPPEVQPCMSQGQPLLGALVTVVGVMRQHGLPEPTRIEFHESHRVDAVDVTFSARVSSGSYRSYEAALAAMDAWAAALELAPDCTSRRVSSRRHGMWFGVRFYLTATSDAQVAS